MTTQTGYNVGMVACNPVARALILNMESRGYIVWPRLKDIIEFSKSMKYKKTALLFCPDLWREAKKTCRILSENGFTAASRVCGIGKSNPQAPDEYATKMFA